MRVKLTCTVISKTRIPEEVTVRNDGHEYVFHRDDEGFINSIDIIAEVSDAEAFYGPGVSIADGRTVVIHQAYDVEQNRRMVREFQELESLLGYAHHLYRIRWEWPARELLNIRDEDMARVGLTRFNYSGPSPAAKDITKDDLQVVVDRLGRYSELTTLLSFFREGKNDFANGRNINGFYNFYFVLEGLYGNGKTNNAGVLREFLSNENCVAAFGSGVELFRRQREPHFRRLIAFLEGKRLETTLENLIRQVVLVRGVVHHYNRKSSIPQATPFDHGEFEPWCEYLYFSCTKAIDLELHRLDAIHAARAQALEPDKGPDRL
jgi:hypothetical protein